MNAVCWALLSWSLIQAPLSPEMLSVRSVRCVNEWVSADTGMIPVAIWLGVDPNQLQAGYPLLLLSVLQQGERELNLLLETGADPNLLSPEGVNALMLAVLTEQTEMLAILLAAGANPDLPHPEGSTALMMAATLGHTDMLRLLLRYGADAQQQDQLGQTAQDYALLNGHQTIADLLSAW